MLNLSYPKHYYSISYFDVRGDGQRERSCSLSVLRLIVTTFHLLLHLFLLTSLNVNFKLLALSEEHYQHRLLHFATPFNFHYSLCHYFWN